MIVKKISKLVHYKVFFPRFISFCVCSFFFCARQGFVLITIFQLRSNQRLAINFMCFVYCMYKEWALIQMYKALRSQAGKSVLCHRILGTFFMGKGMLLTILEGYD